MKPTITQVVHLNNGKTRFWLDDSPMADAYDLPTNSNAESVRDLIAGNLSPSDIPSLEAIADYLERA